MNVTATNKNSFGQVIASKRMLGKIGRLLREETKAGNNFFVKNFRTNLKAAKNSEFVDVIVREDGTVVLKGKTENNIKPIKGFSTLLYNLDSALKHIKFAEETKFIF